MSTLTSQVVGPYEVIGKLGEGGMGVVYRAHDDRLGRDIALKVVRPNDTDAASHARLLREARAAASLNHPNICTVHEVGESDGQAYIAMELVEGVSLMRKLASGPLAADDALRCAIQIADAISHAHERGIVHRDLKSANVVVMPNGHVKILDFGLAKRWTRRGLDDATRSEISLTAAGSVCGTLAYMAPEQLRGEPEDPRTDVWALGIVLYEMLTGSVPFHGTTGFELSSAILSPDPVPMAGKIPLPLRAIIERCVQKQPGRRYQSASELRSALEALQTGITPPLARIRYHASHHPIAAIGLVMVTIAAMVTAFNPNWIRTRVFGRTPKVESIAVMPLENLSGNSEQAYLANGIHEALITDLSRLSGMRRVIARSSMMGYANTHKSAAQIARELGVDAIVTGGVLQSGNRVRVSAQLISAGEQTLWADRFERETRDILSLENEVVSAITRGIKLQLTTSDTARLAKSRAVDPESYAEYLKGQFYMSKLTPEGFQKGVEHLNAAVEKDPGNALPWAGLAMGYSLMAHQGVPGALEKAKAATNRALELDNTIAEAHLALAENKMYHDWEWADAEKEFQAALSLNPSLAEAHAQHAWFLMLSGNTSEMIAEMKRAIELDPLNPLYPSWLGQMYLNGGRYDEALGEARKALELTADYPVALSVAGIVAFDKGRQAEGLANLEKAARINPQEGGNLAHYYILAGRRQDASRLMAQIEKVDHPCARLDMAGLYFDVGDKPAAFRALRAAYDGRCMFIPWIGSYRVGAPGSVFQLHSESAFQELLQSMHLPK